MGHRPPATRSATRPGRSVAGPLAAGVPAVAAALVAVLVTALVAALLAGCTSSTDAKVSDTTGARSMLDQPCTAVCHGTLDGAAYAIAMPPKWNGALLLYSHGYRFARPAPPTFAPVQTTPQLSSTDPDGFGQDPLSQDLLARGYALAGSAYRSNGWAVADGVAADEALHAYFVRRVGRPAHVYVWGDSLGGLITEIVAERNPGWVSGAAPMCGAVAGPNLNFDVALDAAFAIKTLIYPQLQLTAYASDAAANAQWTRVRTALVAAALDTAGHGPAKIEFIAALFDAAHRTRTYDGSSASSQVKAGIETLLTALAFGTAGRYEVEQRVGGNASSNVGVDYSSRIDPAETAAVRLLGGDPAAYEAQLAAAPRVGASTSARAAFEALGDTTGAIKVPTITLHTEADPLVLVQNESVLAVRATRAGAADRLVQVYVRAPRTYPESTGAPYGAGHCNFSDRQRVGLITAVRAWATGGPTPDAAGLASSLGPGIDPSFTPLPWPSAEGR